MPMKCCMCGEHCSLFLWMLMNIISLLQHKQFILLNYYDAEKPGRDLNLCLKYNPNSSPGLQGSVSSGPHLHPIWVSLVPPLSSCCVLVTRTFWELLGPHQLVSATESLPSLFALPQTLRPTFFDPLVWICLWYPLRDAFPIQYIFRSCPPLQALLILISVPCLFTS